MRISKQEKSYESRVTEHAPCVRIQYGDQLIFTEVLWGSQGLDLSEAVPQHLTNARLHYRCQG